MSVQQLLIAENNTVTQGFSTLWTVAGNATARTITLQLMSGYQYNCTVYRGDGASSSAVRGGAGLSYSIHTYATNGTYQIEIIGTYEAFGPSAADKPKLIAVTDFGHPTKVNGFKYMGLSQCTNLVSLGNSPIPISGSGLTDITNIFYSTGINYIPKNLLSLHTNITIIDSSFSNCLGLSNIPSNLFKYNINITSAINAFSGCANLITVGSGLFKYNKLCTSFMYAFKGCNKLELNADIFYDIGGASTRFLNQSINFFETFYITTFAGTQGVAPDLWNCDFGYNLPVSEYCFHGHSIASVSNYASIPAKWKGVTGYNMWYAQSDYTSVSKVGIEFTNIALPVTTYTTDIVEAYGICFDGTNMWVTNPTYNSVSKITPAGAVTTYAMSTEDPYGIAFDGTNMWTANTSDESVSKITSAGVVTTYPLTGLAPETIAFDGTNMWTANRGNSSVSKITSAGVVTTYTVGANIPTSIAFNGTDMWTANAATHTVSKITSAGVVTTYTVGAHRPQSIIFAGGYMRTSNPLDSTISKITLGGVVTTYTNGVRSVYPLCYDGRSLWTGTASDNTITQFNIDGSISEIWTVAMDDSYNMAFNGCLLSDFWS